MRKQQKLIVLQHCFCCKIFLLLGYDNLVTCCKKFNLRVHF